MSKIAEQKALEAYPKAYYRNGGGIDDANVSDRAVYEEGYDQAMQDFLEKAGKFFNKNLQDYFTAHKYYVYGYCGGKTDFLKRFKQYMEQ